MTRTRFMLIALFLLTAPLFAAENTLQGTWKADLIANGQPCIIKDVITGNRYSELVQCGSLMTGQSGTYVFEKGQLVRSVEDWSPKGNGYHRPPGGSYRVTFTSPSSMVWQDLNTGGKLMLRRQ